MASASGPPPNRWNGHPLTLVAVGAVALLAGAGGAAIATSGSSPSAAATALQGTPAPSASAGSSSGPPSFRRPAPGAPLGSGRFSRGGIGRAVHGQFVVPASGGGYQTEDIQTGQVTAISSSSITARSADGYAKTYRLTAASQVDAGAARISAVDDGDQVSITATVTGATASVTSILDLSIVGGTGFAPGGSNPGPSPG